MLGILVWFSWKEWHVHTGIENGTDSLNLAYIPACIPQYLTASSREGEGCSGQEASVVTSAVTTLALSLLKHVKKVHKSFFLYQYEHTV